MTARAIDQRLTGCHSCGQVVHLPAQALESGCGHHCPRCGAEIHLRKPQSLARTWVMLIAASLLYLPANLLPILVTYEIGEPTLESTILGGIITLWKYGAPDLAVIVFIASIVVPIAKLVILTCLAGAAQFGLLGGLESRSRLYRWMELIGYWSMLDIFVVALLTAVVQFSGTAFVLPGPAAAAFGAVVVLTMLASQSFDPRIAFDRAEQRARRRRSTETAAEEPARMAT